MTNYSPENATQIFFLPKLAKIRLARGRGGGSPTFAKSLENDQRHLTLYLKGESI
jgi:hypothetical protein